LLFPAENDINLLLNRIYNPELDVKIIELFFILKKYENHGSNFVRKKISFYLKLKGIELNKKQEFILEKIIENGVLIDTVNNYISNESEGVLKFNYNSKILALNLISYSNRK